MLEALYRLLPSARRIIPTAFYVTADNVLRTLEEEGIPFVVHRLGEVDWELENSHLEDDDILAMLNLPEAGHHGTLLIETDVCSAHGLPYLRCPANQFAEFVHAYPHNLDIADDRPVGKFFDFDVIMLCEESRTLTVYHHGGAYAHAQVPQ